MQPPVPKFSDLVKFSKLERSGFKKVKVALLGDSATQFINQAISGVAAIDKLDFEIFEADYNQIERQILDPTSDLFNFSPDFITIFYSGQKLLEQFTKKSLEEKLKFSDSFLEKSANLIATLAENSNSKVIFANIGEIDNKVFGNYSNKTRASFIYHVRRINYELMNLAEQYSNLFILDISSLQNNIGRDHVFAPNLYYSADLVYNLDFLPRVARSVVDIVASQLGKVRKCVILDLDNTLWGGVIGDDGMDHIEIGNLGSGKAFTNFQYWLKQLKERGIILAVCSKNTEHIAQEPFLSHPEMVLKLSDIAVFVANWETKVENIHLIREQLNIGFDSMVFLDDNPFERNMVRESIPELTIPELPSDPSLFLEFLYSLNLFETSTFSNEDLKRTEHYQLNLERNQLRMKYANEDDFLKNLEMVSVVEKFSDYNLPRVTQLINRSNQFNLRTIRYSEHEIKLIAQSDVHATFSFTLTDKYGDNGLIAVVILEKRNQSLFIDTWIMSCRVLKRQMEAFTLNCIVEYAKANGFSELVGEYIPTAKNGIVANHYPSLGFRADGKFFKLDIANSIPGKTHIRAAEPVTSN